jgi:hypothetical protein
MVFFPLVTTGESLAKNHSVEPNQSILTQNRTHKPIFEIQFFSNNIRERLNYNLLEQLGIGKVIVRVFQDKQFGGGLFFSNSVFRVLNPTLDFLIPEFKGKNVGLVAWMITRNFKWVKKKDYFDFVYDRGYRRQIRRFDIFNPQAIDKIISVYKELALKPIDGILLQDDFFIRYNEGFSNWGKAVFANSTGRPARERSMMDPYSEDHRLWVETKVSQIIQVLEKIVNACKKQNPQLEIGMNMYYESPYYKTNSEKWYAHNLEKIVNTGIDYVYLMSYHRQIKKEMKLSEKNNQELFRNIVNRAYDICRDKLVVKIQFRDWDTGKTIPLNELLDYLRMVPKGVKRVCLTPVKVGDFEFIKRLINMYCYPSGIKFKN